jgi:hypothetical protein
VPGPTRTTTLLLAAGLLGCTRPAPTHLLIVVIDALRRLLLSPRDIAARRGAGLLVTDLLRPDSATAARELVDRYAANEPDLLRRDFHRSLLAAFTLDEIHDQLADLGISGLECAAVSDRHWAVWGRL